MLGTVTGITPMLQIIRQIFKDPKDDTDVSLLFANQVLTILITALTILITVLTILIKPTYWLGGVGVSSLTSDSEVTSSSPTPNAIE